MVTQSFTRDRRPLQLSTNFRTLSEAVDGSENYYGVGATVTVSTDDGHIQSQVVDGGSGQGSQRSLDLVFGLGNFTGSTVDVEVKWPGGSTQTGEIAVGTVDTLRLGAPEIESSSVEAFIEYDFSSQQYDWVFEWETNNNSDVTKDKIVFNCSSIPSSCLPDTPNCELIYGQPQVTVYDIVESGGVFHHKLTWRHSACSAPCRIPYRVASGIGTFNTMSSEKVKKIYVCIGTD